MFNSSNYRFYIRDARMFFPKRKSKNGLLIESQAFQDSVSGVMLAGVWYNDKRPYKFVKKKIIKGNEADRYIAVDVASLLLVNYKKQRQIDKCETIEELICEASKSEKNIVVLRKIASSMQEVRDSEIVLDAAMELTSYDDEHVRRYATGSFGAMLNEDNASDKRLKRLIELTADSNSKVRFEAIQAVANLITGWSNFSSINRPDVKKALLAHVTDTEKDTRGDAFFALALLGDKKGLNALKKHLEVSKSITIGEIRAADEYGNTILYKALLALKNWWKPTDYDGADNPLDMAIRSCSPNTMDRFVTDKTPQEVADSLDFSGKKTNLHNWHYSFYPSSNWGNRDWQVREKYLNQFFELYKVLGKKLESYTGPFQLWVMINEFDCVFDTVGIKTPNPNNQSDSFPFIVQETVKPKYENVKLQKFIEKQGLEVLMVSEDGDNDYYLYNPKIGQPIV